MCEQLLTQGVGVSVTDKSGWTPLLWAASGGHTQVSSWNNSEVCPSMGLLLPMYGQEPDLISISCNQ